MTNTDDVAFQLGDEVDIHDGVVLVVLALEQHRGMASDVDDGAILELDRTDDAGVKLRERVTSVGHVVAGSSVQVPHITPVLSFATKVHLRTRLIKHNLSGVRQLHRVSEGTCLLHQ